MSRPVRAPFLPIALVLGLPAGGLRAQESRLLVEIAPARPACYVHERVPVALRIAWDEEFFRDCALQPFAAALALPVRVEAPGFEELPAAEEESGIDLVLAGRRIHARDAGSREVGARSFRVAEVVRELLPLEPGTVTFAPPRARFEIATRFEDDLVRGRVPLDRLDAVVTGAAATIEVLELPEQGRPEGFGGAVGAFTLTAAASPLELDAGATLEVIATLAGDGFVPPDDAPRLPPGSGFHRLGARTEDRGGSRVTTLHLRPESERVRALPALTFAYFDPRDPPGYRVVASDPIGIVVRPGAGPAIGAGAVVAPEPAGRGSGALEWLLGPAAALGALALGFVLGRRGRRAATPPQAPGSATAAPIRAATAEDFRAAVSRPGADLERELCSFLAARLRCGAAATIAPDLPARLLAAGAPPDLAERAALLVEQIVSARYRSADRPERAAPVDESEVRAVVEQLDRHLRTAPD